MWFQLLGAFANCEKATTNFVAYVCMSAYQSTVWNNSVPTERIFMKFDMSIFGKSVEKIQVSLQSDKSNVYFIRRPINFLIISRSVVVRVKSVSDKFCRENQNTCFMSSNFFFSKIMLL